MSIKLIVPGRIASRLHRNAPPERASAVGVQDRVALLEADLNLLIPLDDSSFDAAISEGPRDYGCRMTFDAANT